MVYTHKHPALLIMGLVMLAIGASVSLGWQDGIVEYLGLKKVVWEMTSLTYVFGVIAVVVGLWHLFGKHEEGNLDYYLSTVAGVIFILLIAMLVRWYVAPFVAVLSKGLGPVMGAKYLHQVLGLNYVVLGIVAGILVVNVFKVPRWAENGVRLSRLGLKTGVILLGTLYSAAELRQLGALSVVMIGFFVLGSVGMVLWFGARRNIPNSMAGVLSAGMGVCGVSATVAAAPVVQAKSVEIAYTIGTILLGEVRGNRLYDRHHSALGCRVHVPVSGDRASARYGPRPIRGLGGHRHPQLGAGSGCGPGVSARRHRDPQGRGDLQHHPGACSAHYRGVAGGLVRQTRRGCPRRQCGARHLRKIPDVRHRLPAHVRAIFYGHLRTG